MTDEWTPPDLGGQVAVVTGSSRGIGRGIAEVLVECGVRTYLVARTATDDLARDIGAIAAPCDVTDDAAVDALFARITRDEGHLEILVNNAVGWGGEGDTTDTGSAPFLYQPPWHAPLWWWDGNFAAGVRSHWRVTNASAPLFVKGRRGAVFFTAERQPDEPGMQEMVMDLRGTTVQRMAMLYSLHLRPHRVSSIFLYPGFSRTEDIKVAFERGTDYFKGWTEDDFYAKTASVQYSGRAVAALAADPDLLVKTGTLITSFQAATDYGFTDVTGARPDPI